MDFYHEAGGEPSTECSLVNSYISTIECPEGFVDLGTGCYNISWTQMPYSGALAYCTSLDSHLTFITSAEEQGNIEIFLNANVVDGKYTFGGKSPKKKS